MRNSYILHIERYNPTIDSEPYMTTFKVPKKESATAPMTALMALHYINRFLEPIAYEYNCRRGSCGCCAMMIDGMPQLACYYKLTHEHTLKPLTGCSVVRDLVVNRKPMRDKFVLSSDTLNPIGSSSILKPISGEFWRDTIAPINACRECLCCYATCPVIQVHKKLDSFIGPGAFQQLYLRSINGMDDGSSVEKAVVEGLFECNQCGMCTLVCPARIDCTRHIRTLMEMAVSAGLKPASSK